MEVMLQGSAQLLSHSHNIYLLINTVRPPQPFERQEFLLGEGPMELLAQLMAAHSLYTLDR